MALRRAASALACALACATCLPSLGARRGGTPAKGFGVNKRPKTPVAVLPKGTVVKHGTTLDVLPQILAQGLRPSGSISAGLLRDKYEPRPTSEAVYVAKSYVAYSAALLGFTSKMVAGKMLTGLDAENVPLPVVLTVRLQEDCALGIDEDYAKLEKKSTQTSKRTDGLAETLWQKYGSGAILRENGIPPEWIESVECAHVPTPDCLARIYKWGLKMGFMAEFPERGEVGRWDKAPLVYEVLMKEALSADVSQEGLDAIRQDDISSQLLMDDAFKLVFAYYLCQTDEMALSDFASVEKLVSEAEDGSRRLGYVTRAFQGNVAGPRSAGGAGQRRRGVLPIGNYVGHQTWDTEQSTPMKEGLSGERADWASGTGCARTLTYASMLQDCVNYFVQAFGLEPDRRL